MLAAGCGPPPTGGAPVQTQQPTRIVSLDFCADQFVLKLADRENIAALSPDAETIFSYMRDEAKGIAKVRPRAEDILLREPDLVVRTYGGGPSAAAFFEHAGIEVLQIDYAYNMETAKQAIRNASFGLGVPARGEKLVAEMDSRLAALPHRNDPQSILYLSSKGATAGPDTMIDELLQLAGFENFNTRPGWSAIPLERLAYDNPDVIAAGFFETSDLVSDIWTPARHPLAKRKLAETPVINLRGAWLSCGGWFLLDAVEALADGAPASGKAARK